MDRKVTQSFEAVVEERFAAAAAEWGLAGPDRDGIVIPTVEYRTDGLEYCWMFDTDERSVVVTVRRKSGDQILVCDLEELVVAAGLGAANLIRHNAVTLHNLRQAVESHVEWLRRLHPLLDAPGGLELMRRAGARAW